MRRKGIHPDVLEGEAAALANPAVENPRLFGLVHDGKGFSELVGAHTRFLTNITP
jgi:hypothetical protein